MLPRIYEKQSNHSPIPGPRRILELKRLHAALQDVWEGNQVALFGAHVPNLPHGVSIFAAYAVYELDPTVPFRYIVVRFYVSRIER